MELMGKVQDIPTHVKGQYSGKVYNETTPSLIAQKQKRQRFNKYLDWYQYDQ